MARGFVLQIGAVYRGWRVLEQRGRGRYTAECRHCGKVESRKASVIRNSKFGCKDCGQRLGAQQRLIVNHRKVVGRRFGPFYVTAAWTNGGRSARRVICVPCGKRMVVTYDQSRYRPDCGCGLGGTSHVRMNRNKNRERIVHELRIPQVDFDKPYEDDPVAQMLVESHPDGMTLDQIGTLADLSRERIRQIEVQALKKLIRGLAQAGYDDRAIAQYLAAKTGSGSALAACQDAAEAEVA